jgi:hypothetical protein
LSLFLADAITAAPALARPKDIARPMPAVPPTTTAILFCRLSEDAFIVFHATQEIEAR